MKKIVACDDGHGLETAGKRTPPFPDSGLVILENEFNHAVKVKLIKVLERCGLGYIDVSPERTDTPLSERAKRANDAKADIFISIHYNALDGKWNTPKTGGIETYHYPGSINGEKLAKLVHKYLIQGTVMPDRGVKTAKFYVLKYTHMPAILIECGFMDVLSQAKLMLSEEYQWECAEETGHAICDYFSVEYKDKPETTTDTYYKQQYFSMLNDIKEVIKKYENGGA
jgi:N-acetylmuramoyl-L-alanine amidase